MATKKIPTAVLKLANRQAKVVVAERADVPQPPADDAYEPELRSGRQLVREKIVTGLRKLHPMD